MCCCKYDDSALRDELERQKQLLAALEARMAALEKLAGELNAAIDDALSIVSYTELADGAGWRIAFSDGSSLDLTNGLDGADGKDGTNGKDGKDGTNGTNGKDGTNGTDGTDGKDGKDGTDGKDGKDGTDGDSLIESIAPSADDKFIVITLTNGWIYTFAKAIPDENDTTGPLSWALYSDGMLVISGTGDMPDYGSTSPWDGHAAEIKKVVIESGVTRIGRHAFTGYTSLVSVTIPESVSSIGLQAFRECTSLESVTIPGSAMSSDGAVFMGCTSLVSVTIQEGFESIGGRYFYGTSLESITIPESVREIGDSAFGDCTNLADVTILATSPPALKSGSFMADGDTLHVPVGCVDAYRNAEGWKYAFKPEKVVEITTP